MNYGADLQACALQQSVQQLGYSCELLDVLSPKHPDALPTVNYKPLLPARGRTSKKQRLNRLIKKAATSFLISSQKEKQRFNSFEDFKKTQMVVSSTAFRNVDQLYTSDLAYDAYICGSDQIWNPYSFRTSPEPYFLTFAKPDARKIAYAPSFGASTIPDQLRQTYAKWISSIHHLSARETHGAEIIADLTKRQAPVVLDPSLLITNDQWLARAKSPRGFDLQDYVLLYDRIHTPYGLAVARHIAKRKGLQIVRIPRSAVREGIEVGVRHIYDAGPSEFLYLFSQASYVVTSSFHGTAFSINFQKPFFTIIRCSNNKNNRMQSLISKLQIKDRLLQESSHMPHKFEIDYKLMKQNLIAEREQSIRYLVAALDDSLFYLQS